VGNAVAKRTSFGDVLSKDRSGSPRKVDAAVAMILTVERSDMKQAGKKGPTNNALRGYGRTIMALLGAVGLAAALYLLVTPVKLKQAVVNGGLLDGAVGTSVKAVDLSESSDITVDCGSVFQIYGERLTAGSHTDAVGGSPVPTAPLSTSTLPAFFSLRHVAHQVDTGVGPARFVGARGGLPVINCGPAISDRRGSVVKVGLVGIVLLVVAFLPRPSRIGGATNKAEGSR